MKKIFFLIISTAMIGCSPPVAPDAPLQPIKPMDTSSCAAGCAKLKELKCSEAGGSTPSDPDSCRKDCEYVQNNGLSIRPSCWVTMKSCSDLETICK